MTYTLHSNSKPTIYIHAEQAMTYEVKHDVWVIYKIRQESETAFLFVVIEVSTEDGLKKATPKEYRYYNKIISEPINEIELLKLVGIKEDQSRDILNEMGIDWEDKTAIVYGIYPK